MEYLIQIGILILYFVVAATIALLCRKFFVIPDEIFRKILHCILLFSLIVFVCCFDVWWVAALTAVGFEIVVFPILFFLERLKSYSAITTERTKGELKFSLLLVFTMFAIVISICWGWLGDSFLVLASVYAWGFGDAAAALVGKRIGKHKFNWKFVDKNKSIEGSAAMFVLSFLSVLIVLLCRGGLGVVGLIVTSVVTALASTFAELYSHKGFDTIVCPFAAMAVLLPLIYLFGGLA